MYKTPNATLPITASADINHTALVCAPARISAVESIGNGSPPTAPLQSSCPEVPVNAIE